MVRIAVNRTALAANKKIPDRDDHLPVIVVQGPTGITTEHYSLRINGDTRIVYKPEEPWVWKQFDGTEMEFVVWIETIGPEDK